MSVYFIGCLHLGHENMARHRGFESSLDHDRTLINHINSVVSKRDKLFLLGDITMETSKHYNLLSKINGLKHVILGNHDRHQDIPELLKYVHGVSACVKYKGWWLSHIPIHPIEFNYRVSLNVHAHLHDASTKDKRYFNVDAHGINYTPVSYSMIVANRKYHEVDVEEK